MRELYTKKSSLWICFPQRGFFYAQITRNMHETRGLFTDYFLGFEAQLLPYKTVLVRLAYR